MTLTVTQEREIADAINARLYVGHMSAAPLGEMFPELVESQLLGQMIDHFAGEIVTAAGDLGIVAPTPEAFETMAAVLNSALAVTAATAHAHGCETAFSEMAGITPESGDDWVALLSDLVTDDDGFPIVPADDDETPESN